MPIPEAQLETWSHQGPVPSSAATYNSIRQVLMSPEAPYSGKDFEVFLQGSYGNDTNIYADSDVDIVIALNSIYYYDTNELPSEQRAAFEAGTGTAQYTVFQFRQEVLAWLRHYYGQAVQEGSKAIYIPSAGNRREADVLACAQFRNYYRYVSSYDSLYNQGIVFWDKNGTRIVNYPRQHSINCTAKHQATSGRFKPTVRILKNLRNRMCSEGVIEDGLAPSYFLEGMLYNVPPGTFGPTHSGRVSDSLNWLLQCNSSDLLCANERFYLLREGSPVTWRKEKFDDYLAKTRDYWNAW